MGALKVWDGASWQTVAADGKSASVFVGPDAPTGTAHSGDLWYDTDDVNGLQLPMSIINGGTGATTAAAARTNLAVPSVGQSASTSGAPTTGTWARGDTWIDVNNVLWACTVAGTPGTWMSTNRGEELAYAQVTANQNITNGSASAQVVVDSGTRNYDGNPIWVEFYCPIAQAPPAASAGVYMNVWDGATDLGVVGEIYTGSGTASIGVTVHAFRKFTPTVGSHNYKIGGWVSTGTGVIYAGSGGTGSAFSPAYIRVTRA